MNDQDGICEPYFGFFTSSLEPAAIMLVDSNLHFECEMEQSAWREEEKQRVMHFAYNDKSRKLLFHTLIS